LQTISEANARYQLAKPSKRSDLSTGEAQQAKRTADCQLARRSQAPSFAVQVSEVFLSGPLDLGDFFRGEVDVGFGDVGDDHSAAGHLLHLLPEPVSVSQPAPEEEKGHDGRPQAEENHAAR